MRIETLLLILGLVVFFEPFLGVPAAAKAVLAFVVGIALVTCALTLRHRARVRSQASHPVYVDGAPREGTPQYDGYA